jgi:hypothetical protein
MWPVDPGRARRRRDARTWLLVVAGICGLLLLVFVVVSVVVVGAATELELCDTPGSSSHGRGHVTWVWLPPHPECVWKADAQGHAVGPPVAGEPEVREAVVFDGAVGAFAIALFLVAFGGFVGWIVLMVREAEQIAEDQKNSD